MPGENPKKLYGHQEWPPLVSVEKENVVDGHWDMDFNEPARQEVREKFEEGRE